MNNNDLNSETEEDIISITDDEEEDIIFITDNEEDDLIDMQFDNERINIGSILSQEDIDNSLDINEIIDESENPIKQKDLEYLNNKYEITNQQVYVQGNQSVESELIENLIRLQTKFLGQQLMQSELTIIELKKQNEILKQQNSILGQQLVDIELQILSDE